MYISVKTLHNGYRRYLETRFYLISKQDIMTDNEQPTGTLFIVAAPSGTGKTSLVAALIDKTDRLTVSVSHTTRSARKGEIDGVNYHFVGNNVFLTGKEQGQFLEYAEVFGNYYGTSKAWVDSQRNKNIDVILEIDWQGALQVMEKVPDAVSIFILPPSVNALRERLSKRGQDKQEIVRNRMNSALNEISKYKHFNYLVINADFTKALHDLSCIVRSQRLKQNDKLPYQQKLIHKLLS